jgi:hypothetical protein
MKWGGNAARGRDGVLPAHFLTFPFARTAPLGNSPVHEWIYEVKFKWKVGYPALPDGLQRGLPMTVSRSSVPGGVADRLSTQPDSASELLSNC